MYKVQAASLNYHNMNKVLKNAKAQKRFGQNK